MTAHDPDCPTCRGLRLLATARTINALLDARREMLNHAKAADYALELTPELLTDSAEEIEAETWTLAVDTFFPEEEDGGEPAKVLSIMRRSDPDAEPEDEQDPPAAEADAENST